DPAVPGRRAAALPGEASPPRRRRGRVRRSRPRWQSGSSTRCGSSPSPLVLTQGQPAPSITGFATCSSCEPWTKTVTDVVVSNHPAFRPDVARSVRLFRAFRTEQAAPSAYYAGLARDTIRQLGQYLDLNGQRVVDVGGGPGFFVREFREAGALALCLDTDSGE